MITLLLLGGLFLILLAPYGAYISSGEENDFCLFIAGACATALLTLSLVSFGGAVYIALQEAKGECTIEVDAE